MELIFLSSGNALRDFRKEQYDKQGGICPVLKQWVPFEETVVDHLHGKKTDQAGVDNAHMVRGIIHNYANACEGKMLGKFKRSGLSKMITFPQFLISLGEYIENPPLFGSGYVHPEGKPKRSTIGKREFNRVIKYWSSMYPKRKPPVWKDKGRNGKITGRMTLTKPMAEYIREADELHYGKYSTLK